MKVKKNMPAVFSSILLLFISIIGLFLYSFSSFNMEIKVISVLMGVVIITAVSFLDEKLIYKYSLPVYVCVNLLLLIQLIAGRGYNGESKQYIIVGSVLFFTASVLPLISIFLSTIISKYEQITIKRFALICILIFLPLALVFLQHNLTMLIVSLIAFFTGLLVLIAEKRVVFPKRLFVIFTILAAILAIILYLESGYFADKIDIIITRGKSDPLNGGLQRIVIDSILKSTPFFGEATFYGENLSLTEISEKWGNFNAVVALARYGWGAFLLIVALYSAFFVCVFKMVSETKQSVFSRYTSLLLALSLAAQTFYSLVGMFLMDRISTSMSFMGSYSINAVSYLSFGIILMLYSKRNKFSVSTEKKLETDILHCLKGKIINLFETSAEYDDENLSDI